MEIYETNKYKSDGRNRFVSAMVVILSAISVYLPAFAFIILVTPAAIGIVGTKWGPQV